MKTIEHIALRCWYADNENGPIDGSVKLVKFSRRLADELAKQDHVLTIHFDSAGRSRVDFS